ncbi:5-formyltetrahydrofolate cyclo-ligase [Alkalihalophilus pseudofirmus]|nr:5-formyltetrahydrofolate cyclo-ligase [Alkalihalophilus pseudofirmus]
MKRKKELRSLVKEKLNEMTEEEYMHNSKMIKEHLCSTVSWKNANTIAITISRGKEVDTYKIIKKAWQDGKNVVVPRTYPELSTMVFFKITDFNELENTYFQLKEPKENVCLPYECEKIDLIIVPGVAFDREGNRLGYGGGYYDRYLVNYPGQTCAIAFEKQLVTRVPVELFDIPVQMIITEDSVFKC